MTKSETKKLIMVANCQNIIGNSMVNFLKEHNLEQREAYVDTFFKEFDKSASIINKILSQKQSVKR